MRNQTLESLENLRDRLVEMINGSTDVDIGTLTYQLNKDIKELGGREVKLTSEQIRSRFFVETD